MENRGASAHDDEIAVLGPWQVRRYSPLNRGFERSDHKNVRDSKMLKIQKRNPGEALGEERPPLKVRPSFTPHSPFVFIPEYADEL
jgi:hypothetical protein